ncbi:MAG: phosphate--acyl-ACP acyltransferase, partial [Thermodesulfobacteriota bacterium]|nr:phosphate--acyl-ACP acyltransferase [Thermodesulfobacteriota bacterium]
KLGTGLAKSGLRRFARIVDYAEYGGAPLLGLQNIVIVCHGSSSKKALANAVKMAARFAESKANEHLIQKIAVNAEFTQHRKAAANNAEPPQP